MLKHLWTRESAPLEYVELVLCREWGCPPDVVRRQRLDDVMNTLTMLGAEAQVQRMRAR